MKAPARKRKRRNDLLAVKPNRFISRRFGNWQKRIRKPGMQEIE
jgi:hypothetical protein